MKFKLFLLVIVLYLPCHSQQSKLSKTVNHVSAFIASDRFTRIAASVGDLEQIDSIFNYTAKFTEYDYQEALLALAFVCVPYREIPIQLPLIGSVILFPLTSADEETFLKKNENLPRFLFFDSPQDEYGDKDKSAHFFGSAYLANASNLFDLGNLIGYFVEVFEAEFKVQSSIDNRDMQTNYLGQLFGSLLKENKDILPSHILIQNTLFYIRPTQ